MKTYTVEIIGKTQAGLVGYYYTLKEAKQRVKNLGYGRITMMKGDYFGEGFHQYYLEYINGKFKYSWKRY